MSRLDYTGVIDQIYASGYFTNHGPLAKELECSLERFYSIDNAVVVGNETLAIVMALAGLNIDGRIAISAYCPDYVYSSVVWSGLSPVVIDADVNTHNISLEALDELVDRNDDICAVMICDMWGANSIKPVIDYAYSRSLKVVVYQFGYFANSVDNDFLYSAHDLVTVGVVGDVAYLPTNNCASIFVSEAGLAEKYRNIRSSYGARKAVSVKATANGRVSELQAGLALSFLNSFEKYKRRNALIHKQYNLTIDACEYISRIKYPDNINPDYGSYAIIVNDNFPDSSEVQQRLERLGEIASGNDSAFFKGFDEKMFPIAKALLTHILFLPVSLDISPTEAAKLSKKVVEIFDGDICGNVSFP